MRRRFGSSKPTAHMAYISDIYILPTATLLLLFVFHNSERLHKIHIHLSIVVYLGAPDTYVEEKYLFEAVGNNLCHKTHEKVQKKKKKKKIKIPVPVTMCTIPGMFVFREARRVLTGSRLSFRF